jgi:hypothetical protein
MSDSSNNLSLLFPSTIVNISSRRKASIFMLEDFNQPRIHRTAETEHRYLENYKLILKLVLITSYIKRFRLRRSLVKIHAVLNILLTAIQAEQIKHQQEAMQHKSIQELIDKTNNNNVENSNTNPSKLPKPTKTINFFGNPRQYSMQFIATSCEEYANSIKSSLIEIFNRFPTYRRQLEALFQRNMELIESNQQTLQQQQLQTNKYNQLLNDFDQLKEQNNALQRTNAELIDSNKSLNKTVKRLKQSVAMLTDKHNQLYIQLERQRQITAGLDINNEAPARKHTTNSKIVSSASESHLQRSPSIELENFASTLTTRDHLTQSKSNQGATPLKSHENTNSSLISSPLAVQLAIAYTEYEGKKLEFEDETFLTQPKPIETIDNNQENHKQFHGSITKEGSINDNDDDQLLQNLFFKSQIQTDQTNATLQKAKD